MTGETVQEYLEALDKSGAISFGFAVNHNHTTTGFKHEFRQAISITLSGMRLNGFSKAEDFVCDLMREVRRQKVERLHLYVTDAAILFGAPFDILLSLITDNGASGVMEYENTVLALDKYSFITQVQTWTVPYNHKYSSGEELKPLLHVPSTFSRAAMERNLKPKK